MAPPIKDPAVLVMPFPPFNRPRSNGCNPSLQYLGYKLSIPARDLSKYFDCRSVDKPSRCLLCMLEPARDKLQRWFRNWLAHLSSH
jgi:hypothetical protein